MCSRSPFDRLRANGFCLIYTVPRLVLTERFHVLQHELQRTQAAILVHIQAVRGMYAVPTGGGAIRCPVETDGLHAFVTVLAQYQLQMFCTDHAPTHYLE